MPVSGRLTWTEMLDEIQRRQSENTPSVNPQFDVPYFLRDDIEQTLLEVSNAKLRALGVSEIGSVGTLAVTPISGTSPLTMPVGAIGIISATIDSGPAVEVDPSRYYFMNTGPHTKILTVAARQILFIGTSATVNVLIEPDLAVWQSNPTPPLLPPGYDEPRIAEVCSILELEDFLPIGREN